MKYVVIEEFCDMQDGGRSYAVGDIFPRLSGLANEARLKELASSKNKLGRPLIKAVEPVKILEDKKLDVKSEEPLRRRKTNK